MKFGGQMARSRRELDVFDVSGFQTIAIASVYDLQGLAQRWSPHTRFARVVPIL